MTIKTVNVDDGRVRAMGPGLLVIPDQRCHQRWVLNSVNVMTGFKVGMPVLAIMGSSD